MGIFDGESDARRRQRRIERHIGGAGLQDAEETNDQIWRAVHADGHGHVRTGPQPSQVVGNLVGTLVECPVAKNPTAAGERDGLGGAVYLRLDQGLHPRGLGPFEPRGGPSGNEPGALQLVQKRRLRDPPRRTGAEGAEQPEIVPAQPSDRLRFEEVRVVLEDRSHAVG